MSTKPAQHPAQYAVFGNPIAHSRSPMLHAAFAKQCNQYLTYRAILAPLDQFEAAVLTFIASGGAGANVTVPFKLQAYQLCTNLTPRARSAGAVNTLWFEHGLIFGDNTDGCGLQRDIVKNAGVELQGRRILLCGAGGAARGAILPLLESNPTVLTITNRSMDKAQTLATEFCHQGNVNAVPSDELAGQFDVIINATSSSLMDQRPMLPDHIYKTGCLAVDMMYGDLPTPFMQHASAHQALTRDGWGMLVEQAAEAFYMWRGVRPDTSDQLQLRG